MKNILLIGGGGYVGTVISSYLLKLGFNINVLDKFVYKNSKSIESYIGDSSYKFFYGDFIDKDDLKKASDNIDVVVVLGGLVGDPITKSYPDESDLINNKGIKSCIDYFDNSNIEKLIFISTCSNYGLIKDNELADEDFELNPLSLYAKAKVSAEKYLINKKNKVDYSATILRFATAFGLSPRMRFDLTISEFVRDLYFGNELEVFDEHTWRPYCHVRDFARLIHKVIIAENEVINFEIFNAGGENNNATKQMIVNKILERIPDAKVKYKENGSDPRNYKVSFQKIEEKLGFKPKYSIDDGVKELINAFRIGLYDDSIINKEQYGNYVLNYKK